MGMRAVCSFPSPARHCYWFNLLLRPNGVTFTATPGTSEFLRKHDPAAGDVVSFKFRGFMLGSKKPKHPTLYRVRTDLAWDDVVKNFKEQTPNPKGLIPFLFANPICTNNFT